MNYSSPELVVIGRADVLVQGRPDGTLDHEGSIATKPVMGFALGLDD